MTRLWPTKPLLTIVAAALLVATQVWLHGQQPAEVPAVRVTGEPRQWHKVTLTLDGPEASETSTAPNPFLDYRMTVTFVHESGAAAYAVPGYFAADGNAAETSAASGNKWRAHFAPDRTGRWTWQIAFLAGEHVAIDPVVASNATPLAPYDGLRGSLQVLPSNKTAPDLRARGRLQYVGQHHLRFAGTGEYFLKAGSDSPETLLAYADFDGTVSTRPAGPLKTYAPHVGDWKAGDPSWKSGKGKGLIGAVNYLASQGINAMSFLTYNAGGDGDNVWPFVARGDKRHYDVSKLDQWQIVFDHAQQRGLYLHFKLQETENDDNVRGNPVQGRGRGRGPAPARGDAPAAGRGGPEGRGGPDGRGGPGGRAGAGGRGGAQAGRGPAAPAGPVVESLDGGDLGIDRKLYLREIVARFGHALALNWNLGEENTQTPDQQRAMAGYISSLDPYRHHIVVHTYPDTHDVVYPQLVGGQSALTGASLQILYDAVHERTVRWVVASARAGRPWVVGNDEQGPANLGVPPDPGYKGFAGKDGQGNDVPYTLDTIRKLTLWGNLMGGGAGVEYYFGYQLPENDLVAEDFRSREKSWEYARIALAFFRTHKIPFWEMQNVDALVGNAAHDNSRFAFAKAGEIYLVYLPNGGTADLDLAGVAGRFSVRWFNPRTGGALRTGSVATATGGTRVPIGGPPDSPGEDWLAVVRRN
jgi:hypothetical protein